MFICDEVQMKLKINNYDDLFEMFIIVTFNVKTDKIIFFVYFLSVHKTGKVRTLELKAINYYIIVLCKLIAEYTICS